jgi:two-component system phosphate regulon response regulator OmpR
MLSSRILVVDDDKDVRDVIVQGLEMAGFSVAWAPDCEHARAVIKGQRIDAALIDMRLPGESGIELARALRATRIPVLLVTGDQSLEPVDGLPILFKPFRLAELGERVHAIVKEATRTPIQRPFGRTRRVRSARIGPAKKDDPELVSR